MIIAVLLMVMDVETSPSGMPRKRVSMFSSGWAAPGSSEHLPDQVLCPLVGRLAVGQHAVDGLRHLAVGTAVVTEVFLDQELGDVLDSILHVLPPARLEASVRPPGGDQSIDRRHELGDALPP